MPWKCLEEADSPGVLWSADLAVAKYSNSLSHVKHLIAGGMAGCLAKTCVAPLSRVTILMQVQSMRPHKFVDGVNPNNVFVVSSIRKILREEGPRGLFRGNGANLLHRFPYSGVTFYANGALGRQLSQAPQTSRLPKWARGLIAGWGSGMLGCTVCYPLDVVKVRLITQTKSLYYAGVLDAIRKIMRDEGVQGFYRGLPMSLASTTPSVAISFTMYDVFFTWFEPLDLPLHWRSCLAGGSAAAVASTIVFPVDLVRRQMQLLGMGGRPHVYANVFQAFQHVYSTGTGRCGRCSWLQRFFGCREFFRGLAPELLKVMPHNAIMFSVHRQLINQPWPLEQYSQ